MRWGFMVFLFCYIGYIAELYRFSERYLEHFRIDKKVFIILLPVMEAGINTLNERVSIPYILLIMISHILYLGLFCLFFSDSPAKKIFTAMLLITVRTIVLNFGCSFFRVSCWPVQIGSRRDKQRLSERGWKTSLVLWLIAWLFWC